MSLCGGPGNWGLLAHVLSSSRRLALAFSEGRLQGSKGDKKISPELQALFQSLLCYICYCPIGQSKIHGQVQSHCVRELPKVWLQGGVNKLGPLLQQATPARESLSKAELKYTETHTSIPAIDDLSELSSK